MERSRADREGRRQRLAWALIGTILLVVIGILVYAYYTNFIVPPRAEAAKIRETTYTQGDLVKRLRLLRASTGGQIDLGRAPWEVLFGMVEAELIRQGAEFEGVVITDEDADAVLRGRFYRAATEGQEVEPGQLETEYQERYQAFLTEAQISDQEYRVLVSDDVYRAALREALGERIPRHSEHVDVSWIQIPHDAPDPENPPPRPVDIIERLRTDPFETVAREVGGGRQGWIPKGVFPELDETLFGADPPEPLAEGEVSSPVVTRGITYIVKSLSLVEMREVDEKYPDLLEGETPVEVEHMEVSWIELTDGSPDPDDVLERLDTEDFQDVAEDIGGASGYKDWVPLGAYPQLDDTIFGPQPLGVGDVSKPITGDTATFILTVLGGPEVRELDEDWLPGLKEQALQKWIQDQWALGRQEGWVEVYTDSDQYKWVVDQYNKSVQEEQQEQAAEN